MPSVQPPNQTIPLADVDKQTHSHPLFANPKSNRNEEKNGNDEWQDEGGSIFANPSALRQHHGQQYRYFPRIGENEPSQPAEGEQEKETKKQRLVPHSKPHPIHGYSQPGQRAHEGWGPGYWGGFGLGGGLASSDVVLVPGHYRTIGNPIYGTNGCPGPHGFGSTPGMFPRGGGFIPMGEFGRGRAPWLNVRQAPDGSGLAPYAITPEDDPRSTGNAWTSGGLGHPNGFGWWKSQKGDESGCWRPDVDIFETPDNLFVYVSLSGGKKEDMEVSWDPKKFELTITGTINRPGDEEFQEKLVLGERKVGRFERKVCLGTSHHPAQIDVDAIIAEMHHGILQIEIPKLKSDFVDIKKVDIE